MSTMAASGILHRFLPMLVWFLLLVGVLALFALAQELNFKLAEPEYLPQKRSPDSGSGSLRGRPDLPGVTRRPSAAAISSAKRALPKAKLPLLA